MEIVIKNLQFFLIVDGVRLNNNDISLQDRNPRDLQFLVDVLKVLYQFSIENKYC